MIVFDLECINGHAFEGWFDDGDTFHRQQADGLVTCPVCQSTEVSQKLSAVAVRRSSGSDASSMVNPDALKEIGARLAEFVTVNFEDVGTDFAKQALKMHYGAAEQKNIRGVTTAEEDRVLSEEGVSVLKIPLISNPDKELN